MQERISAKDAAILEHLVNVTGVRFGSEGEGPGNCGYVVKFFFSSNAFFAETILSVKVVFANEEETIIKAIEGTDISWSSKGVSISESMTNRVALNILLWEIVNPANAQFATVHSRRKFHTWSHSDRDALDIKQFA